jgi:hypothetical protein
MIVRVDEIWVTAVLDDLCEDKQPPEVRRAVCEAFIRVMLAGYPVPQAIRDTVEVWKLRL